MNNATIRILFIISATLFAIWASTELVTMKNSSSFVIIASVVFILLLLLIGRNIPMDVKLALLCFAGYCILGKGFAYLSPAPPFYIGEIALAFCVLLFLVREIDGKNLHRWTGLHFSIMLLLIYGGIHLVTDFPRYGLLSIRDAATVYYGLFFFIAFAFFGIEKLRNAFNVVLLIVVFNTTFYIITINTGLQALLRSSIPSVEKIYFPHVDIMTPAHVSAVVLFSILFMRGMGIRYLFLLIIGLSFFVMTTKTSAVVALIGVCVVLALWAKFREITKFLFLLLALGFLLVSSLAIYDSDLLLEKLFKSQHIETFSIDQEDTTNTSASTLWRLQWWGKIWDDTMEEQAFWGQGFGADITSQFYLNFFLGGSANRTLSDAEIATMPRYPHNIIFTIIGRLGLIGLVIFSIYCIVVMYFCYRFCREIFRSSDWNQYDLIAFSFFLAGFGNSFLQATYESPYAAIPHWICLGYLARRLYDRKYGYEPMIQVEQDEDSQDQETTPPQRIYPERSPTRRKVTATQGIPSARQVKTNSLKNQK